MKTRLNICALRSSSKGNSVIVFGENTKILVDCGVSGRVLEGCLAERSISPLDIDALVITHEHIDHVRGVGIFSRKYNIPVFANASTWGAMGKYIGGISEENIRFFETGKIFRIGGIDVKAFEIPHDAAEPVGFVFRTEVDRVAVATDMGEIRRKVMEEIQGCSSVMIEANYDLNMLEIGKYPYTLKRRIKSPLGHLCNDDAGILACGLVRSGTKEIILGHLSGENNYPDLAYHTVKNALEEDGFAVGKDVSLYVIKRDLTGVICPGARITA